MASTDLEMTREVRQFLGYSDRTLSEDGLNVCLTQAKRWISNRKFRNESVNEIDWYAEGEPNESALFWHTCLYAKVASGELDAPNGNIGDIKVSSLSSDDTLIYHQASQSLREIGIGRRHGITRTTRDNRTYGDENEL